ncbi:ead/Ea22-like family protein [Cronobacter sakazakii]|nr:ead/Ea22-like family protein [Cronobacter sakazakii]ELY3569497.1 ead/Ea22-like family protein [Cronobacter sakazakii]ELY3975738.1 ead/Ea22-like family protein [Cronobacter sakazakii]
MTDTAKLKAAALAAGGEEWAPRDQTKNCGEYTVIVKGSLEKHSGWTSCRPVADEVVNKQTMKFIALANPAAVLELIAALEAAQKRIAELEARKVKLPSINPQMFNDDVMFGYRKAQREAVEFCAAAGINLETGGE